MIIAIILCPKITPLQYNSLDAMANPVTLTALSPREAILDALHRSILGVDTNDWDLLESGCLKSDMTFIAGEATIEGWTSVREFFTKIFNLVTTHYTSNIRIELQDGADTASMTAHALAYHVRPADAFKEEDTSYTVSCVYYMDLVKDSDDGLWKVKKWEIKNQWTTGDKAVIYG